jgi:hypothetical protein
VNKASNYIKAGNLRLLAFLGSNKFLALVLAFFVIESLWVAISFRYPMVFDEWFHLNVIDYFSRHPNPVPTSQSPEFDTYGSLAFGNASLFHYVMSVPYLLITNLTSNFAIQVVFLRFINILLAATGLYLFSKLARECGIKQIYTNIGLLFYALIPLSILVAATISYDNLLLPLTAYLLLIGVRIMKTKKTTPMGYGLFLLVGMAASLVKFTFLPIFVAGLTFLLVHEARRGTLQKSLLSLRVLIRNQNPKKKYGFLILFIVIFGLFLFRYGVSTVRYHTPLPECTQLMSYERCMKNPVFGIVENAERSKDQRPLLPPAKYSFAWSDKVLDQYGISASPTTSAESQLSRNTMSAKIEIKGRFPIFSMLSFILAVVGVAALLFMWRSLPTKPGWSFVVVCSLALVITTFTFNYMSYRQAHLDVNTQGRYLLSVVPIIMIMSLAAVSALIGKGRSGRKLTILITILFLALQGGGVVTHILSSNSKWYWPNHTGTNINEKLKNIIAPVVEER